MINNQKVLVVCGPTGVGKTALAVKLAKKFSGEIVSADSRQVYREMDIITGKDIRGAKWEVSREVGIGRWVMNDISIWLVDVINPDQKFSVADFYDLSWQVISDIWQRGKLPIIVGGTGFYIKAVIEDLGTMGIAPDWELRKRLSNFSVDLLVKTLEEIDLKHFQGMNESDRKNPRRLIRAVEIALQYKKSKCKNPSFAKAIAGRQKHKSKIKKFESLIIGLTSSNKTLYKRIDKRVEERVQMGAEKEIKKLLSEGYNWDNSVLGLTIGYREWKDFFDGKLTKEEVIQKWKFAEHNYTRRQMTWFKKMKNVNWFRVDEEGFHKRVENLIESWYI